LLFLHAVLTRFLSSCLRTHTMQTGLAFPQWLVLLLLQAGASSDCNNAIALRCRFTKCS
jgi:hypothetical protein